MKAYAVTDVGRTRDTNQDYFYYSSEPVGNLPNLYLVADGMGGHKAGDLASRFTVENVVRLVESYKDYRDPVTILAKAINEVNRMLIEKSKESEDYEGMGTTLVAATIDGDVLKVANVGDSRLYLIEKDILQITRDHSLVEEMVLRGQIDKEEARTHVNKNIITRAILQNHPFCSYAVTVLPTWYQTRRYWKLLSLKTISKAKLKSWLEKQMKTVVRIILQQ